MIDRAPIEILEERRTLRIPFEHLGQLAAPAVAGGPGARRWPGRLLVENVRFGLVDHSRLLDRIIHGRQTEHERPIELVRRVRFEQRPLPILVLILDHRQRRSRLVRLLRRSKGNELPELGQEDLERLAL